MPRTIPPNNLMPSNQPNPPLDLTYIHFNGRITWFVPSKYGDGGGSRAVAVSLFGHVEGRGDAEEGFGGLRVQDDGVAHVGGGAG
jgi:hypothetical protein